MRAVALNGRLFPLLRHGLHHCRHLTLSPDAADNYRMPVPRITKEELQTRIEGGGVSAPVVVDVRLKYPYEHSTVRLPGAVRLDPPDFETSSLPGDRDRDIVTYDSDPEEIVGARVAAALIRQGYRASVLQGGIVDWLTAKLPTESKDAPKQKPPQAGALKG